MLFLFSVYFLDNSMTWTYREATVGSDPLDSDVGTVEVGARRTDCMADYVWLANKRNQNPLYHAVKPWPRIW